MRNSLVALAGIVIYAALVSTQAAGQQPAAPAAAPADQDRGVQVGVPAGRGGRAAEPARGRRGGGPPPPAPRRADGRVLIGVGARPTDKGIWLPGPVIPDPLGLKGDIPYQPWARALAADRRTHQLEPHARCKPSGIARVFLTPYGVEIVELPELQRVYIFDIGGPHTYRTIYMDGRAHPRNWAPDYYGHSVGWWDGDTLVVETTGFNDSFWLDRGALPHTDQLKTIERFTRADMNTIRYELTIDDPGAYTRPFSGRMNLIWESGTELFEFVCQEANYAHELMVGQAKSVDRTTLIVP
jgi:hypothetical protein